MNLIVKYKNKYSNNETPDKFGRWSRIATYKDIEIGVINMVINDDVTMFSTRCYFPTEINGNIVNHKMVDSIEEGKKFIEEKWVWFLTKIK